MKLLFVPLNNVIITGYCTHDPEVKYAKDGLQCCDFQIGFKAFFLSKGKRQTRDGFVQIAALGHLAELAGQLRKGIPVCVIGSLREDSWFTGGRRRSKVKVLADQLWRLSEDTLEDDLARNAQGEHD